MIILGVIVLTLATSTAVPRSPKIALIEAAVGLQQQLAVEAFWAEISRGGGTPLIECPDALQLDCLVTFLWRGDASTQNVLVRAEATPGAPAEHLFNHVPGTDLWYRTYRFRNDARFMYMLSINDPLTPWDVEGPEREKRYAGVRTDPLNQRNACYVSLPRAPSERWSEERQGVPEGKIRQHQLASKALSGNRTLEIYSTPGFQPERGITPVLIMFDGDESRHLGKTSVILDNLFAAGKVPRLLAVFLYQPYERREADLSCSDATNAFLVNELMPWLRGEYGVLTSAERTIVAGSSLGGLASAYAVFRHPETFGRALSQSGAFWWGKTDAEREWLTGQFSSKPRGNAKFYLDVGLMETEGGAISQLSTNRRLKEVLRRKGYKVIYREFNGTHSFPCWRADFPDALMALLSD